MNTPVSPRLWRRLRTSVLAGLLVALILGPYLPSEALTRGGIPARRVVSYCIESPPTNATKPGGLMSVTGARARLTDALNAWMAAAGVDGYPALALTQDIPCKSSTDVRVRRMALDGLYASASDKHINFNTEYNWWDGTGTRPTGHPSFLGVLVHEIGHTVGADHAGGKKWSDDGDAPSMQQAATPEETVAWQDISRDDWAHAVNIAAHATSKPAFVTANPGFEHGLDHWGTSGSVATSSTYAHTGGRGARLATAASFVYTGAVYDPWRLIGGSQSQSPKMLSSVIFTARADYRHTATATTGGPVMRYNTIPMSYPVGAYKNDADTTVHPPVGQISLSACPDPGTTWTTCTRTFVMVFYQATYDARLMRYLIQSHSSGHLYVDRAGFTGGTSS